MMNMTSYSYTNKYALCTVPIQFNQIYKTFQDFYETRSRQYDHEYYSFNLIYY